METIKKTFITPKFSNAILNWVLGKDATALGGLINNGYKLALGKAGSSFGGNNFSDISPTVTNIQELSNPMGHSGYSRCNVSRNINTFSEATDKKISISAELSFPEAVANWTSPSDADNDKIRVWGLYSDSNVLLLYGHLQHPRNIEIETMAIIPANENQIRLDICNGTDGDGKCIGSTTDMQMSDYASHAILNHLFRGTSITLPENYYVGISAAPIATDVAIASEANLPGEPKIGVNSYKRLELTNDKSTFSTAKEESGVSKVITLNSPTGGRTLSFPKSVAAWKGRDAYNTETSRFTHFFIADAATNGNIWWSGKFVYSRLVDINTILTIKPGTSGFVWKLDNCHLSV